MIKQIEDLPAARERMLRETNLAYGHFEGLDDVDRLCLRISNLRDLVAGRAELERLNAQQAQEIARLTRKLEGKT